MFDNNQREVGGHETVAVTEVDRGSLPPLEAGSELR